jgi:predicted oxidoreductase
MQTPALQIAQLGPQFSRIVLGLWRMADWSMSPQQRLSFLEDV